MRKEEFSVGKAPQLPKLRKVQDASTTPYRLRCNSRSRLRSTTSDLSYSKSSIIHSMPVAVQQIL